MSAMRDDTWRRLTEKSHDLRLELEAARRCPEFAEADLAEWEELEAALEYRQPRIAPTTAAEQEDCLHRMRKSKSLAHRAVALEPLGGIRPGDGGDK